MIEFFVLGFMLLAGYFALELGWYIANRLKRRFSNQNFWICRDCGLKLSNANLAEWDYGCRQLGCEVGWHHTPCSRSDFHGSSRLKRRFK